MSSDTVKSFTGILYFFSECNFIIFLYWSSSDTLLSSDGILGPALSFAVCTYETRYWTQHFPMQFEHMRSIAPHPTPNIYIYPAFRGPCSKKKNHEQGVRASHPSQIPTSLKEKIPELFRKIKIYFKFKISPLIFIFLNSLNLSNKKNYLECSLKYKILCIATLRHRFICFYCCFYFFYNAMYFLRFVFL